MVRQIRQVAGVDKVEVEDFQEGLFAVTPEEDTKPAPRAIWDAAVKSGFTPTLLATPEKTYKSRPSVDD